MRAMLLANLVLLLGLAALPISAAGAAPLSPSSPLYNPSAPLVNENPDVVVDYKGTITDTFKVPAIEAGGRAETRTATLEWDESVAGPVDQIEYTGVYGASSIHWHINKLSGEVKDEISEGANKSSCKGAFSPTTTDGGEQGVFLPLDEPGHPAGGGNPATNPDYSVRPPGGMPVLHLSSSAAAGTPCETNSWNGTGTTTWGNPVAFFSEKPKVQSEWGSTVIPTVYFPPGGGHTQALEFATPPCNGPSCGPASRYEGGATTHYGEVGAMVKSSITFSSPELPGRKPGKKARPKPTPPPCFRGRGPTCDDKLFAAAEAFERVSEMGPECAITTLTLANIVVSAEQGSISLAEAESAVSLLDVGSDFVCTMQIAGLFQDLKIINDPPTGGLRKLAQPTNPNVRAARLPSCRGRPAAARSFCEALRTDELRYQAALRGGVAINAALLTTVDRVSGAYKARNGSALKLQVRHAAGLRSQEKAARGRVRGARRAIAALLKSHHLGVTLTAAQVQGGIAKALAQLSRHGVSQARLERAAHVNLAAAPTDLIAQLSR